MRVIDDTFARTELETLDAPQIYDLAVDMLQTLSRLLAYDRSGGMWRMLECDSRGRIIMSGIARGGSRMETNTISVTTTTVQLFSAQSDRVEFIAHNLGSATVRIADSASGLTNGFQIMPGITITLRTQSALFVNALSATTLTYLAIFE